jgi:tetratricopeptide (TPR) repeat protein
MKRKSTIRTKNAPRGFAQPRQTELSSPASLMANALALHQAGRLAEAEKIYQRILAAQPGHFDSLHLLGVILFQRGNHAKAVQQIDIALKKNPDNVVALNNRGNALLALSRFEEALASYDRALALRPDYADALCNHGAALHELKRYDQALASCDRTIALRPDYAEAHSNRGNTLRQLKRYNEALASCERALALAPNFAEAHCNRGNALYALQRFEEALASYDRALALRSSYAEALTNRGVVLQDMMRLGEALASHDGALAVRPDFAGAHVNQALCLLLMGDFGRGWQKHEWRWDTDPLQNERRRFAQPLWIGSPEIAGKTILLHAEQGFGDTLQFCRYVPLVAQHAARVILEVQGPLCELLRALPGAAQIVARGDALPDFDMHCPLLSLPLAFATRLDSIPSKTPYLTAPESKAREWRKALGKHERPRVGLVWAGNPRKELPNANRIDAQRSIAFAHLTPLFQVSGCGFFSLQKGEDAVQQLRDSPLRQHVVDRTDDLHDFSDTAALIENLDLVIAVDTAVAHLAGALGKPFWLLNRYNTCWRWLLDREDSPWYPTARLFRQDDSREWDGVIARVCAALHDYIHSF